MTKSRWMSLIVLPAMVVWLTGCSSMGPRSVVQDRFDYTRAISDSWKSQMLVNIVGVRYGEAPIFLEVVSVINQYEAETQGNLGASWQSPLKAYNNINANTLSVGGSGKYTDRPTITYSPLSGEKFATGLMKPVPPAAVLSLVQSGFPADLVFRLTVHSINGLDNRHGGASSPRPADPQFYRLLEKWKRLQASGAIALRIQKKGDEDTAVIVFKANVSKDLEEEGAEVRRILKLDPRGREFKVVFGAVSLDDREIAILSRSVLQIMMDIASHVDVPEDHVAEKYVNPTFRGDSSVAPLIRVHSSPGRPSNAYAAVPYQDHWFWIDNRDLQSKQIFSFLTFIFTLTETGGKAGIPAVTISAK